MEKGREFGYESVLQIKKDITKQFKTFNCFLFSDLFLITTKNINQSEEVQYHCDGYFSLDNCSVIDEKLSDEPPSDCFLFFSFFSFYFLFFIYFNLILFFTFFSFIYFLFIFIFFFTSFLILFCNYFILFSLNYFFLIILFIMINLIIKK